MVVGPRALDYLMLTKPRIVALLLVTTVPSMILARRGIPSFWLVAATLLGGMLAAGGSNAINQYLDRDIDQIMGRTRRRPVPAGRITPRAALGFGVGMGLMLPVIATGERTGEQIFRYSLATFAASLMLYPVGHMGGLYLGSALILGAGSSTAPSGSVRAFCRKPPRRCSEDRSSTSRCCFWWWRWTRCSSPVSRLGSPLRC